MSKNPFLNALAGLAYIALVVLIMNYGSRFAPHPKSILLPMTFLSVFSLSAAMMGYIFLYNPGQLFLEGKKKEATRLFLQTLMSFAVITIVLIFLAFSGILGNLIPTNF